jgi:hypothetical protein
MAAHDGIPWHGDIIKAEHATTGTFLTYRGLHINFILARWNLQESSGYDIMYDTSKSTVASKRTQQQGHDHPSKQPSTPTSTSDDTMTNLRRTLPMCSNSSIWYDAINLGYGSQHRAVGGIITTLIESRHLQTCSVNYDERHNEHHFDYYSELF